MQDDFAVALALEAIPSARKLRAEFQVVVDLTVVGQPQGSGAIGHGLVRGPREIDDLEPSVSQAHARLLGWHGFPCPGVGLSLLVKQHVTEIIWPPMRDAERHTLKDVRRQWPCIELVDPANSAHGLHLRPFTGTSKFFQDCAETREMLVKGGRVEGPCGLKKTAHHCMYRTAHDD